MELSGRSLNEITKYAVSCISEDESGRLSLLDPELGDFASDCTTIQVASFLAEMSILGISATGATQSRRLLADVVARSGTLDWFGIPYNAPIGGNRTVDLAEFGAAATSAFYLAKNVDQELGAQLLATMADRIQRSESTEIIGAYYKNDNAILFDVLNGDLYAALILANDYSVTKNTTSHHKMTAVVRHLIERFNRTTNQWPYSEFWDGRTGLGMSVAYQATITGWGRLLLPLLSANLRATFLEVLELAEAEILIQLELGRNENNEVTTWVSDWDKVWEIWQAVRWCKQSSFITSWLNDRTSELNDGLDLFGIDFMTDIRTTRPNRTVLGSKLRSLGNLVAIQQNATMFASR